MFVAGEIIEIRIVKFFFETLCSLIQNELCGSEWQEYYCKVWYGYYGITMVGYAIDTRVQYCINNVALNGKDTIVRYGMDCMI